MLLGIEDRIWEFNMNIQPPKPKINLQHYTQSPATSTETTTVEIETLSAAERENLRKLRITNDIAEENKLIRRFLIGFLSSLSFLWMLFTARIIWRLATSVTVSLAGPVFSSFYLPDGVAIAFITTSLATVVGLWAIGLKYFFNHKA